MKNAMAHFLTPASLLRLRSRYGIDCGFSQDLADIADIFSELQDARHLADYDAENLDFAFQHSGKTWASFSVECVHKAQRLFDAWNRAQSTHEAKWFLAFLVFEKKLTR